MASIAFKNGFCVMYLLDDSGSLQSSGQKAPVADETGQLRHSGGMCYGAEFVKKN